MARKHNAERAIRGRSHRKGWARIYELKAKSVKKADTNLRSTP